MDVASPEGTLTFVTAGTRASLSRQVKAGRAVRLAPGVYVLGATLPPEVLARRHRVDIIAHVWPGAVLCGRSALSGGEPVQESVFIAHPDSPRASELRLPGLVLVPQVGPSAQPGDVSLPGGVWLSGDARKLVENVHLRGRPLRSRAGTAAVEDVIDGLARTGGAGRVQTVLAQLDVIAGAFDPSAVELVRTRLAAVLGTTGDSTPMSLRLRARLAGQPYDHHRIERLQGVVETLQRRAPTPRTSVVGSRWQWLPFFEAYFSNYIEGTRFGVDEARAIAVDGEVPGARPADAHDVAATYRLASSADDAIRVPRTPADLVEILRARHQALMAARPDQRPGSLKEAPNFAGGYRFVEPELVRGTLHRGFQVLDPLGDAFARAVAMMVLVTEVHGFDDGNGRVARLMVNAELSAAGQVRVVIPTVYRNNYLAGLGAVSNGAGAGEALIAVLDFAQKWSHSVDWSSYEVARNVVGQCNGFLDAGRAEADGLRLQLPPS